MYDEKSERFRTNMIKLQKKNLRFKRLSDKDFKSLIHTGKEALQICRKLQTFLPPAKREKRLFQLLLNETQVRGPVMQQTLMFIKTS